MSRLSGWVRSFLLWQAVGLALLVGLCVLLFSPPCWLIPSPLSLHHPYCQLPRWHLQELYHTPSTNQVLFAGHKDPMRDWTPDPSLPASLYRGLEALTEFVGVTLPAKVVPPPLHLVHLMQGPARLQVLRTLVLLGVPDVLADKVLSLRDLHAAVLANEHKQLEVLRAGIVADADEDVTASLPPFSSLPLGKLERLMNFALSLGFFDELSAQGSRIYVHNSLSVVLRSDHPNCLNHLLLHFSNEAYLAWHRLPYAMLSAEEDGASGATDGATPLGGDAELAGLYSTPSSKQALEENQRRKDAAIARLRATAEAGTRVVSKSPVPTAWEQTHKQELWEFFAKRPALERNFAAAMSEIDRGSNRALVANFDWSHLHVAGASKSLPVEAVVDVGGAEGSFLAAVLQAHPSIARGVLFDLEGNIARARGLWNAQDAAAQFGAVARERDVQLVAGDFFDAHSIPLPSVSSTGAVVFVLRQILHDWDDRAAALILHNLRRRLLSAEGGARGLASRAALAVIEVNRRGAADRSPSRAWIDGQMLVCCNARERTPAQWDVLARSTGWRITAQQHTRSTFEVMEMQIDEDFEQRRNDKHDDAKHEHRTAPDAKHTKEEL